MAPHHCAFLRAQVDFDAPLGYKEPERQAQHEESAVSRPPTPLQSSARPPRGSASAGADAAVFSPPNPLPGPCVLAVRCRQRGSEGPGEGWGPTEKLFPFPCPSRKAKLNTVATPGSWASV